MNRNMPNPIEITIGDVTDMEAHIVARYTGPEHIQLCGTLQGPFCENVRTLAAEFVFRSAGDNAKTAEAIIVDPCMWAPDMPQLYRADVQATAAGQIVAEYHGTIGLQRTAPRRPVDFAPGTG